jgi:hypothetical protein
MSLLRISCFSSSIYCSELLKNRETASCSQNASEKKSEEPGERGRRGEAASASASALALAWVWAWTSRETLASAWGRAREAERQDEGQRNAIQMKKEKAKKQEQIMKQEKMKVQRRLKAGKQRLGEAWIHCWHTLEQREQRELQ